MSAALNNRILVVDDNPAIHEDFRKILLSPTKTPAGLNAMESVLFDHPATPMLTVAFDLASAFQGQEALGKVTQAVNAGRPYALAFVDVRMPPGWDGIETIERLWQVDPHLQIVVCTAYSDYSWEKMTLRLGVSENLVILKKPFDNIEVLQLAYALTKKWQVTEEARVHLETLGRVAAERARENECFAKAFRASPVPFAIQTLHENRFIDVNDAFLQMTGFERGELLGRTPLEVPLCIDYPASPLGDERPIRHVEGEVSTKAGDLRSVLVSVERIVIQNETHLLLMVLDISERLRLETKLRQAQKVEAVGQLAAGVAHDFNNLLTIIQGRASLLLTGAGHAGDGTGSLQEIALAAQRAADLTRQLLAFSRRQLMRPRVLQLNDLIRDLAAMVRRLPAEPLELRCELADDLPLVWADQTGLEQVVMNLTLNARDAISRGGQITISTGTRSVTPQDCAKNAEAAPGAYVSITVTDTGTGMDAATLARIFEPFFTTKEPNKGTGMGLATAYGIVKQHGGWIEVASEPGRGSQFVVFLPATDRTAEPREENDPLPACPAAESAILLAEDDDAVRSLVREVLGQNGYRVLEAENGEVALAVWKEHAAEIGLLLTDMVMPGSVNGLALAERLLAERPNLKVIYTSGYSAELFGSDVQLEDGVNYLPKPYLSAKLTAMIRRALKPEQELPAAD